MVDYTADGQPIEAGLIVWNYDLKLARVTDESHTEANGTTWYRTVNPISGLRGSIFNGDRMAMRLMRGRQRQAARDALIDEYVVMIENDDEPAWAGLDTDMPCGGCGAPADPHEMGYVREHREDCPWIEALNSAYSG